MKLPEDDAMKRLRAKYSAAKEALPKIMVGANLTTEIFWHGILRINGLTDG
jgi:purine nucleoside permease